MLPSAAKWRVIHLMYADGKQKEGQTNCSLVFCKKGIILHPCWRKYLEIYFKILFRMTAKEGLWKYLSYHYVEIAWKIVSFLKSIWLSNVHSAYLALILFWNREIKYNSYIQGKQQQETKVPNLKSMCILPLGKIFWGKVLHFKDLLTKDL